MPSVGQVLYVIHQRSRAIEPILVLEEITRKSATGVTVDYEVGTRSGKRLMLSTIQDKHYETPEELRDDLFSQASVAIQGLISQAVNEAKMFGAISSNSVVESQQEVIGANSPD